MTLREIQRAAFEAITRKLTPKWRLRDKHLGRFPFQFVKHGRRQSAAERVEVYARGYWGRLLNVMRSEFPQLREHLGAGKFDKLCVAYLDEHPSHSYSLNDLSRGLPAFVQANPKLSGGDPKTLGIAILEATNAQLSR